MNPDFTVLISSAGRRVSLLQAFRGAVTECIGPSGRVIASDASPLSAAARIADASFLAPRCDEPGFVDFMLNLCREQGVRLLVPTIDTELLPLAEHRDAFERIGTHVVSSSPAVVAIASDKRLTHQFLRSHGLPTVRQTEPSQLTRDFVDWTKPLIAKPRRGSASVGVRTIGSLHEGQELALDYVIEEIAPGREYTMDVFLDAAGDADVIVPRLRLETRGGEVSKGMTASSDALHSAVANLCSALPGAADVLTVQAFMDEATGEINIIEINPRFGGGYPLAHAAGVDYPLWLIQRVLGRSETSRREPWVDGLVMLRYDDAVFARAPELGL